MIIIQLSQPLQHFGRSSITYTQVYPMIVIKVNIAKDFVIHFL